MKYAAFLLMFCLACHAQDPGTAPPPESPEAQQAEALFWQTFHDGDYARLPQAQAALKAVYDNEPDAPRNTLMLAYSHMWGLAESARAAQPGPLQGLVDSLLADRYFGEAEGLNPNDPHVPAWLATVHVGRAIHGTNAKALEDAITELKAAVPADPQFNGFFITLMLSALPRGTPHFQEALDALWQKFTLCLDAPIDHNNPDLRPLLRLDDPSPRFQACWKDTDKAPHRFEGLALVLGDILLKNDQPEVAGVLYRNAKIMPGYATWRDRAVLEGRLGNLAARAAQYQDPDPTKQPVLWGWDQYVCVTCHQR